MKRIVMSVGSLLFCALVLSGCGIVDVTMQGSCTVGEPVTFEIEIVPVDFQDCGLPDGGLEGAFSTGSEGIPDECSPSEDCTLKPLAYMAGCAAVFMKVPDEWEFLGCEYAFTEPPATPLTAPPPGDFDREEFERFLSRLIPEELWEPGYRWQPGFSQTSEPCGPMGQENPAKATCSFLPRGQAGVANLSYVALALPSSAVPPGDGEAAEGNGLEEDDLEALSRCLQELTQWLINVKLLATRSVFCEPESKAVPAVSGWGIALMALLLSGSAVWYLRRRIRRV
jgi:hypothetical protein